MRVYFNFFFWRCQVRKRRKLSRKKSGKMFVRGATKVHARNGVRANMRGGYRL